MPRKKNRQWGKGEINQLETGFQIRWRENGRRPTRSGIPTRDEAERLLAKIKGDIAQGRSGLLPDSRGVPPLKDLADPILERRKKTHRCGAEDKGRWTNHLEPHLGHLKPSEIDVARIRAFVEAKLIEKCNPASVRIMVALLSFIFNDLIERRIAGVNPARGLPESVLRLMRPTYDPKTTPFIEQLVDVRRIYLALPEPLNVAYAIGAFGGLRTGEVLALRWMHVDLAARRIHVRESIKGPLKDDESRIVPVLDSLAPILAAWKLRNQGESRVVPPMRIDAAKMGKGTPGPHLAAVLEQLELARPGLGWYEATRHTFASQWVMAGGSIEKLKEILGHYSVVMTERYAHLKPEHFTKADLATFAVDLEPGTKLGTLGHQMATASGVPNASN